MLVIFMQQSYLKIVEFPSTCDKRQSLCRAGIYFKLSQPSLRSIIIGCDALSDKKRINLCKSVVCQISFVFPVSVTVLMTDIFVKKFVAKTSYFCHKKVIFYPDFCAGKQFRNIL
jgi:hypothetical protein